MRSTDHEIIFVSNNNLIELRGLRDETTGDYLNAATVTVTVKDSSGNAITGDTWPKTMQYVTDSDGNYRANVSYAANLSADATYTASITADAGAGKRGQWEMPMLAKVRRS